MKYTLLVEPSTANNSQYDTTLTLFDNNKQVSNGFIAVKYNNENLIHIISEYYNYVNTNNCNVVFA
mgnify:CR=1 FL=1